MIGKISQETKKNRDNGDISLTLEFGSGRKNDLTVIPVIQFIISNCKSNALFCGRKGGYYINMKGLCRDYNVKPSDSDDICIGEDLHCTFHNLGNVVGKTKEHLDECLFLPINNCFHNISFCRV